MSDFEQYSFSTRPFIETSRFFRGADDAEYSVEQFRDRECPEESYPLQSVVDGYYGEPVSQTITVVPCPIWNDKPSSPMTFNTKLIVIDKASVSEISYTPPSPSQKDGYLFVAKGSGSIRNCPRCGSELVHTGSSSSDWAHHYRCQCGGVIDVTLGDIDGMDSWEYFEPASNTK